MTNKPRTPAQEKVLDILLGQGGEWVRWKMLDALGGNAAACRPLVDEGIVQVRDVETAAGYTLKEWRIDPFMQYFAECAYIGICDKRAPLDYIWDYKNTGEFRLYFESGMTPYDAVEAAFGKHAIH